MLFILVLLRQPLQTVTNRKTHAIFCRNTIKIERVFLNYNPSELLTFCALDEIAVMGLDAVDDRVALAVLARDVDADRDMAALDLMVDGLADVVQQAGALGHLHVGAELGGHVAGEVGDLQRVAQHVLPVFQFLRIFKEPFLTIPLC